MAEPQQISEIDHHPIQLRNATQATSNNMAISIASSRRWSDRL
jgi:hypothetical protein